MVRILFSSSLTSWTTLYDANLRHFVNLLSKLLTYENLLKKCKQQENRRTAKLKFKKTRKNYVNKFNYFISDHLNEI